ncbi:hypothetical protein H0H93_010696 [Arthromyces matolae]|nr:hypothetical protein H0H93_010696 [Arthromyces matolae]
MRQSWILEEEASFEILQAAWELGINTFDSANVYSNGESERVIGKWIQKNRIPRERLIITSKCWNIVGNDPGVQWSPTQELRDQPEYVNQGGLSRAAIFNAIDASLKRLNLTYIDLYQIHAFDRYTPVEETMKALHDLVESGKVRYIGACNLRTWQFALMNEVAEKRGWTKFVSMQSQYSLLYREEEREMNAYCNYHGIGIMPYGVLAKGLLARPAATVTARTEWNKGTSYEAKATEAGQEIVDRVTQIAEKRGVTRAQVALAWIQTKVASPIVGVSTMKQLLETVTHVDLTDEEITYLEQPIREQRFGDPNHAGPFCQPPQSPSISANVRLISAKDYKGALEPISNKCADHFSRPMAKDDHSTASVDSHNIGEISFDIFHFPKRSKPAHLTSFARLSRHAPIRVRD